MKRWLGLLMLAGLSLAASAANAAPPPDKLDRDLAEHPYVGKLYVRSFKAGVRVPAAFRGEWSSDAKTCGIDGDDLDTRIFVDAVTVGFGDETHVVTRAAARGARSVALTYGPQIKDYHYMAAPPVLSLSADGKTLRGWDAAGKAPWGRWMRCPQVRR